MSNEKFKQDVLNNNKYCEFPYNIEKIDPEINLELLNDFKGEKTGFVQVGPKKYFFPSGYEREAQNLYNFQSRPGDIWVVTFPRSGTTWTQEMVWLLENNLDFEKAAEISLNERVPFFEWNCFVHEKTKAEFLADNSWCPKRYKLIQKIDEPAWKTFTYITGPRIIKTHLPFSLLPPNLLETGCKVIYVARNPKDVAVSFYHLNRSIRTQGYIGNFTKYWNYFQNNLQPWTPYWEHLQEGWSRRNHNNVLFLFYEELNKDLRSGIEKVANFLNKHYLKDQIDKLEEHLKIDNFRKNKSVNSSDLRDLNILIEGEAGFVRKGKSGGWRDYFTDELLQQADEWIEQNLANTDLRFPV